MSSYQKMVKLAFKQRARGLSAPLPHARENYGIFYFTYYMKGHTVISGYLTKTQIQVQWGHAL